MAQNSFYIKGWLIAILIAIIALFSEDMDKKPLYLIIAGMSFLFWYLDGYYLKMERMYRWKYDWVIKNRINTLEFSYDLNPHNKKMWLLEDGKEKEEPNTFRVMFTTSLIPFYFSIIIVALALYLR